MVTIGHYFSFYKQMRATWDYVGTGVVRPAHCYHGLDDEDHDKPGVEEFVQQQRQRGHSPAESNR